MVDLSEDSMESNTNPPSHTSWPKILLNGFLVWLVAFILYLVPAFIVAVPMGFDLGPKLKSNAEVGRLISQAVSELYRSTPSLHYGYIIVLGMLILWRSRVISRHSAGKPITHGVLLAIVPVILTAAPLALGGNILPSVIAMVVFLLAGITGAFKRVPTTSPR